VESILLGSRAAALIRERQAQFGDVLVTIGGGTGVEHLAALYQKRRRSVIPLDLPLGSSREDGTGGSERLARESRAEPTRFITMRRGLEDRTNAQLAGLATRQGAEPDQQIADRLVQLLSMLVPPRVFYVRLLDQDHARFGAVEKFFRGVVDAVVEEAGLERVEMGTDESAHAFMNVAIFEGIHFSTAAVVDITGHRPNCFIELALARGLRTIVTAEKGTPLLFDQQAIPCYFWKEEESDGVRQEALRSFWKEKH